MRKRRVYLILAVMGVVLAGLLVAVFSREREPVYGGKRLSEWVEAEWLDRMVPIEAATNAIRHIGCQGVPFLLRWIKYESPAWKQKLIAAVNQITSRVNSSWKLSDEKAICRGDDAMMALIALGPEAADAIPALARLAKDGRAKVGRRRAANVLRGLVDSEGPPSLEIRIKFGQFGRTRDRIVWDTSSNNPISCVRLLEDLLTASDRSIRSAANNALREIDPQALERATR